MVTATAAEPTTLLARATLLALTARALAYPTAGLLAELADGRWLDQLRLAAAALDEPARLAAALAEVAAALAEAMTGPAVGAGGEPVPGLAEEYTRLFARQVLVAPYASSYAIDPGQSRSVNLQAVMAFYTAFGLRVDPAHPELPDHIGAQLEFLAALAAKEAYASSAGLSEPAAICRAARARFVGEHVAGWLPRFVERLHGQARLAFYPSLGSLALALLADEPGDRPPLAATMIGTAAAEERFVCGMLPGSVPVDEPEGL
jgi:TorA maturation chaperone TorD